MAPRAFKRAGQRRVAAERRRDAVRARRVGLGISAAGAFALVGPASAAADFQVTTLNDGPVGPCSGTDCATLRDAVSNANAAAGADTITFASGLTGTLRLTQGEIPISSADPATIAGPGAGAISISGDADNSNTPNTGDSRIFLVSGGGAATISGLTLIEGYVPSSGGPFVSEGGAVSSTQSSPLTVRDSVLTANTVAGAGGALGVKYAGDVSVEDSTITGNTASQGSGGGINSAKYAEVSVDDSTITGNTASGSGGGIDAGGKYTPFELSDSTVSGNTAGNGGGLFFSKKYCSTIGGFADCLDAGPSDSEITNTTITGNHASGGAVTGAGMTLGGLINGDNLSITHTTLSGNDGPPGSSGGGLALTGTLNGDLELVDSTISGNLADVGGGIVTPNSDTTNAIPLVGLNGSLALDNSTIAANTARVAGGGIYLGRYPDGMGGYESATIPLGSTIVADNTANGNPEDLDRHNTTTGGGFDLSFSLVEVPGDAPTNEVDPSILGVDPLLGLLQGNGGPTQTQRPAFNSPVIDKGAANGLSTDQRGFLRTVDAGSIANASDGTDIGAVELSASELNPPAPPDQGQTAPPGQATPPPPPTTLSARIKRCKHRYRNAPRKLKVCIKRAKAKARRAG